MYTLKGGQIYRNNGNFPVKAVSIKLFYIDGKQVTFDVVEAPRAIEYDSRVFLVDTASKNYREFPAEKLEDISILAIARRIQESETES